MGIPLKEVLQQFSAQLDPPEEKLTAMEMKMKNITDGKDLSNYQIYELMKDQMDVESRKTMEQAQNEKSEQLRQKMSGEKNMTPEDMIELLRADLGSEDRVQLEKMLKNGCSIQEVIDHF